MIQECSAIISSSPEASNWNLDLSAEPEEIMGKILPKP
jgi:hypothetical protein